MPVSEMSTRFSFYRFGRVRTWLAIMVVVAVAGGLWGWQSLESIRSVCDQSVLKMRDKLAERKLDEEKADAEKNRIDRIAQRARSDARDLLERLKWVKVIEASTAELKNQAGTPRQNLVYRTAAHRPSREVSAAEATFWSFRRLAHVTPPQVIDSSWCENPIDRFILARLEAAGLSPNPRASRPTLRRRLGFDVIGLPPQPEQVTAFVEDDRSDAYERLVTELMNDPGFGERWARVWLDLARYADSNGYEEDEIRPHAYPYRDFVIWAMNNDLPYDQFTRWQIAGDELSPANPMAVAATGFFTGAPINTFIPQPSERFDELDDMVSTMGSAMLGLTVGCARCHDHKYDPIPTSEYYNLVAIFVETQRTQSYLVSDRGKEFRRWFDPVEVRRKEILEIQRARKKENNISDLDHFTEEQKNLIRQPIDPNDEEQERLISLCERCLRIPDRLLSDALEPLPKDKERYGQLKAELEELERALPTRPPMGLTLTGSKVSKTHVLEGGDLKRKEQKVGPGFLAAITAGRPTWDEQTWKTWASTRTSSETPRPRSALAHWMTDTEQGAGALVARVIVNRLWQHHFGVGLVRTPSDFGSQGDKPSHPELLEWLARELVNHNWSLKHIHRLILTSATYRQSGERSEKNSRLDPRNQLLGRFATQRVTAEMMRDSMLLAAGILNRDLYGPGVKPPIPRDAVYNTQEEPEETWPCDYTADRPALWRRSIYVMLKRTVPVPMLRLFDAPDGSFSCDQRKTTTVPTQALAMWNAPFVIKQSERLAQRILQTSKLPEQQVRQVFLLTLSRAPTQQEVAASVEFLSRGTAEAESADEQQLLAELCHVLFMSNEFFYVE